MLAVSLLFGLVVGLADALILAIQELYTPRGVSLGDLARPFGGVVLAAAALHAVVSFFVVRPLARLSRLDPVSLSLAAAGLLFSALFFWLTAAAAGPLGALPRTVRLPVFLFAAAALAGGALVSLGFYFGARGLRGSRWEPAAAGLGRALPFVLLEGIAFFWLIRIVLPASAAGVPSLSRAAASPLFLAAAAGCAALAGGTLLVFARSRAAILRRAPLGLAAAGVAATVVLALAAGLRGAPEPASRDGHPVPRVVLIVIDTLRAGSLSCYGAPEGATPHIDRLAADSLVFKNTIAVAPWTVPSVATIMTGLAPRVHLAVEETSLVPPEAPMLAEQMQAAGYQTHALGFQPFFVGRDDFSRGFDGYEFFPRAADTSLAGRVLARLFPRRHRTTASTEDLARMASQWVELNREQDFFLWLHVYDPHLPYAPPLRYLPDEGAGAPPRIGTHFNGMRAVRAGYLAPTEAEKEWIAALYAAEVRYVDDCVGLFLERLRALGLYDDALIVLTSDHGEELFDHGSFEHGHTLYNELLSVPLIVKLPRSAASGAVDAPVGNDRILPTILAACGMKVEVNAFSGRSLLAAPDRAEPVAGDDAIFSTGLLYYHDREAVIFDGMKVIRPAGGGREECFDLEADPRELEDLARSAPEAVEKARALMSAHAEAAQALKTRYFISEGRSADMNQHMIDQLRSLGYIE